MNQLQIFSNPQFGDIRTIEEDGKVIFCGSDIAKALGYARPNDAVSQHCRSTAKHRIATSQGNMAETNFIPEGDVYRLITHSKLPSAEQFERWVFDEVLPSIRKHGAYMTPETLEAAILNPDTMIRLLTELKDERGKREALQEQAKLDAPKVLFADAVATSHTSILIGDLAKLIRQNGVEIGQKRLFAWMRENGFLIRQLGASYNMPTQRAMDLGLFQVKETAITHSDGHVTISRTTKVTGKGQTYFVDKLLSN